MQSIGYRLVPSMLAAGANRKIAIFKIILYKIVQSQRFIYPTSSSILFIIPSHRFKKLDSIN